MKPKKFPPLTREQLDRFKELYERGCSARLIFKELGQDYGTADSLVSGLERRFANYRQRLGLPARPLGFRPTYNVKNLAYEKERQERRKKRIKKLEKMLTYWPSKWAERLEKWEKELETLHALLREKR
jgi:hypothetical protein